MTRFAPGDAVQVAGLGTGTVREALNGGRYRVEVKGRPVVLSGSALQPVAATARRRKKPDRVASEAPDRTAPGAGRPRSIDLHGFTVDAAVAALDAALDAALRDDVAELRVIHGRSGGRIRAAVHARLAGIAAVRAFQLDADNAGVTVVRL